MSNARSFVRHRHQVTACAGTTTVARDPLSSRGLVVAAPDRELIASIARTANGRVRSPVYRVIAYRDGIVEYDGYELVKVRGHAVGHIDPSSISALDSLFQRQGYLQLDSEYKANTRDRPATISSYRPVGGPTKSVTSASIGHSCRSIAHAVLWPRRSPQEGLKPRAALRRVPALLDGAQDEIHAIHARSER